MAKSAAIPSKLENRPAETASKILKIPLQEADVVDQTDEHENNRKRRI